MDGADGNDLDYDRQRRQFAIDDGSTVLVTIALTSMAGFSDSDFRGDIVGLWRPTIVVPSLAIPAVTGHQRGAIGSVLLATVHPEPIYASLVEAANACRFHESDAGD